MFGDCLSVTGCLIRQLGSLKNVFHLALIYSLFCFNCLLISLSITITYFIVDLL